jgi:DNA polymerase I-like protein with 3'-5' exonuclease and polymerase domains
MEAAGLPERNMAKTFIYGYLYGAGDGKIGQIVGGTEKEGKRLKAAFLKKTPALKKLKEGIDNRLKQQSSRFKTLKGLDGRLIPVRHKHAALNTLLQSAGAIICKMWYLEIEKRIREAGYSVQDAHIVGFIHDEVQIQVRGEYADAIGKITGEAIKQVETDVGFKVPLDAEYQVGTSWAETH